MKLGCSIDKPVVIVKLGGSIISDRTRFQSPARQHIDAACRYIASYLESGGARVILVLGGGAYAHEILYAAKSLGGRYLASCKQDMANSLRLIRSEFVVGLRNYGLASVNYDINELTHYEALENVLNEDNICSFVTLNSRCVPILTGGITHASKDSIVTVSSDDIPLLLARLIPIRYFISLTDVAGVAVSSNSTEIFPRVTLSNGNHILDSCTRNKERDMTGGMRRKVENCLALLRLKIPSYVGGKMECGEDNSFEAIFAETRLGTYFKVEEESTFKKEQLSVTTFRNSI